jgi:hypothetical protein
LGQRREIVVDTNGETVELFVDDHSVGVQRPINGVARFPSVLIAGKELKAVGPNATAIRRMPGPATELRLASDLPVLQGDVAMLTLTAHDADGIEVLDAAPPLTWQVSGPARLLAPAHMTTDRERHGETTGCWYIALPIRVPLQAQPVAGNVVITVAAPGLREARLELPAQAPHSDLPAGVLMPAISERQATGLDFIAATIVGPLHGAFEDFQLSTANPADLRQQIHTILATGWPNGVIGSGDVACAADPRFQALLDRLTEKTITTGGLILADDINCLVADFNAQYHKLPAK